MARLIIHFRERGTCMKSCVCFSKNLIYERLHWKLFLIYFSANGQDRREEWYIYPQENRNSLAVRTFSVHCRIWILDMKVCQAATIQEQMNQQMNRLLFWIGPLGQLPNILMDQPQHQQQQQEMMNQSILYQNWIGANTYSCHCY